MLHKLFQKKDNADGTAFLIAGLGNPEKKYEGTRHNAGFEALDLVAEREGIALTKTMKRALIGTGKIGGRKVLLAKPLTYMNASGEAIRALCDYYKIDTTTSLAVLVDDVHLEAGAVRIREKGSAGGHNGLKNIIRHIGHENFIRIRIGVGGGSEGGDLVPTVLSPVSKEERPAYEDALSRAADAARMIATGNVAQAMNLYNTKRHSTE